MEFRLGKRRVTTKATLLFGLTLYAAHEQQVPHRSQRQNDGGEQHERAPLANETSSGHTSSAVARGCRRQNGRAAPAARDFFRIATD